MRKVIAFSILFFLIFIESIHSQCSMCRAVIESEEGQATAKGINDGIVYLMAIPYILVAIGGWKVYSILKKKKNT